MCSDMVQCRRRSGLCMYVCMYVCVCVQVYVEYRDVGVGVLGQDAVQEIRFVYVCMYVYVYRYM